MIETRATLTCPFCGHKTEMDMPENYCLHLHVCEQCGARLIPNPYNKIPGFTVDGKVIVTAREAVSLKKVPDINNWLGRSQYNDAMYSGSYDEFRIYDYAMPPEAVLGSFQAGPDSLDVPSAKATVTRQAQEFIQMRRDRLTFGMMIGIPLLQLMLFGFAINSDPKHLPTAVLLADHGPQGRTLLQSIKASSYFDFVQQVESATEGEKLLARGDVQFLVTIPVQFSRELIRGDRPTVLLEADATDPAATGNAIGSLRTLVRGALDHDLKGPLDYLNPGIDPVELRIHPRYNPEGITQYNIVPGLMGVVLTMTMAMITGLAITRERERGTMENLLSMPTRPIEVLIGKIIPYILVGYVQVGLILVAAQVVFHVPMQGSIALLLVVAMLFIIANLAVGITFSTLARNQLQAVQMTFFFFLPSIMLSGFMFPFRGMPRWAQLIGDLLPLTHFLRIIRGILLKGNGIEEIRGEVWQIALFAFLAVVIGVMRYRRTLD